MHLPAVLADAFGVSRSDARRAIEQGGVRIDGEVWPAKSFDATREQLVDRALQMGKRRFVRLRDR